MRRSPPTLHPPVLVDGDQIAAATKSVGEFYSARIQLEAVAPEEPDTMEVPLTTVSRAGLFDAYIAVRLRGAPAGSDPISLLVDSGNTTMVLPYWDAITSLPDWQKNYTLLGEGLDPWRVPAAVVRGPIDIEAADGSILSIEDCVFYACTADSGSPDYPRTANFGTGCITNWPVAPDGVSSMQPPLSLVADHPIASFRYAPADSVLSLAAEPKVAAGSNLIMHKTAPPDVRFFDVVADSDWMALVPEALSIGTATTAWPDSASGPIAMIDTGGTCAYLSDPKGLLAGTTWSGPATNPPWASTSVACHSTSDPISIRLGDVSSNIDLAVDTSQLTGVGLMRSDYGTHSLRRTKASIIYRATGNLRAVQILLGHSKIENTVRYLGIDVEDALALAENTEI